MNAIEKISLPVQSAIHIAREVPAGYLGRVTWDYFAADDIGGLRDTHFMEAQVPVQTWNTVQTYLGDPKAAATDDHFDWAKVRLAELDPATNGALGNFLGDMARGKDATHEQREQTAIASTLIIAMGNAAADARLELPAEQRFFHVQDFQHDLTSEFFGRPRVANEVYSSAQYAALELAATIYARLHTVTKVDPSMSTEERKPNYFLEPIKGFYEASVKQWVTDYTDVPALLKNAKAMGKALNELVFAQVQTADDEAYPEVSQAASYLGEMTGVIRGGVRPLRDLRVGEPTYARAHLLNHGVSRGSLNDLAGATKVFVSTALNHGMDALDVEPGDIRAKGIYHFAGFLMKAVAKIEARNDRGPSGRKYRSALETEVEKDIKVDGGVGDIL